LGLVRSVKSNLAFESSPLCRGKLALVGTKTQPPFFIIVVDECLQVFSSVTGMKACSITPEWKYEKIEFFKKNHLLINVSQKLLSNKMQTPIQFQAAFLSNMFIFLSFSNKPHSKEKKDIFVEQVLKIFLFSNKPR
jgi:hypothetical protein